MSRTTALALGISMVVVAATTVHAQRQQRTPSFNEEIQVTAETPFLKAARPRSSSEHLLTFSSPFALPGKSLAPGTYVFRVQSSNTFQVLSADQSIAYAWLQGHPVTRERATRTYEVWFREPAQDGAPRRLTAWFLPDQTSGYQILYPESHAENDSPRTHSAN